MSFYEEQQPSEVVSLVTRNEGDYVVHSTASVYGGGSVGASPSSKDGQVHDLQEALNEKELELMELKQQHAQLQKKSNHEQGTWVAALESRDQAIYQLEGVLKSKERAISALSEREQTWQQTKTKTGEDQLEHEHKVQLLRTQVAQANANVAALRAHLEAEQTADAVSIGQSHPRPIARSLSMALPQDSVDLSWHNSPTTTPQKIPVSSARRSRTVGPTSNRRKQGEDEPLPRHAAPPPTMFADIAAASTLAADSSRTAVRPPSAPGHLQGNHQKDQKDPDQLPRHSAVPDDFAHDVSMARVLHQSTTQPASPPPETAATANALVKRVAWSPRRKPDHGHHLQEEVTFTNCQHSSGHSDAGGGDNELLLSNVYRAQDALRQMGADAGDVKGRLWDLLQDQEALLRAHQGMGDSTRAAVAESTDSLVPAAAGVPAAQFGMLQERAHSAAACAMQYKEENEELQGRVAQLRVDNEELRSMVSDRESSILELQLSNDMLTARLADSTAEDRGDAYGQGGPRSGQKDTANSVGQLIDEVEKVQKRLVQRDAAAKKYKEGCRTLKERVEQLQQVCQKLKDRNTELVEAAPKAAVVQAQHEQELRKLLSQAQDDIEKHRKLAAAAQREKQAVLEQLDDMQQEMKEAIAAKEDLEQRAQAMLQEERARISHMMQQARGEVEQEAAAASEEASQVLSRAEQLRQAAADSEAAATRRIEAANESTRIAETRLAEAREEVSRMQQRLLATEEAASRDTRKIDTLARDVKAEQQHAAATLERLERAHLRIQQLESQLAESDDVVAKHKEAKRTAEEQTADVRFKLQQAERRTKQEMLATAAVQERLEATMARTREAEAGMAEAQHEVADQAAALRELDARVRDSEDTCGVAERKLQELKTALSRAEAEKSSLREAMVQTEALIKKARHEHEQEISEASEGAAAEYEALQRKCNDLQLVVERERGGRERAESCVQEAHAALEKHRDSLEENHTASLQAATAIHSLKERLRDKQADLEARDTTILELQGKLSQAHVRLQQQLAAKDSLVQARQLEAAEYADKENELRAAQARLAEVAPLMRRLAGRTDNRIKAVGRR